MTQKPEKLVCSKRRVWAGYTEPGSDSLAHTEHSVADKLVEHCDYSRHTYLKDVPYRTATHSRGSSWFPRPIKNIHPDNLRTSHQSKTPLRSLQSKTQLPSLLLKTQLQQFQTKTRVHSHHAKNPVPLLPVYQSLVDPTVNWNANMPSSFVSVDDAQENEQHDDNCWCESCTTSRYRSGVGLDFEPVPVLEPAPPPTFSRPVFFHDNIVTFCNQCTMTPTLNDASCGSSKCIVPLLTTTEVGTSGTILNEPDSSKSGRQNSILKKPKSDTYEDLSCFAKTWLDHKILVSCVDDSNCNGRTKPTKCPRSTCLQTLNDNMITSQLESDVNGRKMLYNEGISDDVAKQLRVMHKKHSPMPDLNQRTCSRLSIGGRCCRDSSDNYIPHSHNINSKYHQNCKKELHPLVYKSSYVLRGVTNEDCRTLEMEPLVLNRGPAGACMSRSRCISLPKKLLTSEKNIEAFLKPKYARQRPL